MSISGRKTLADDWIALFWKTVTVLQLQLHEKATSQELKGYKHHPLDLALAPLAVDFKPSSATRNPRRAAPLPAPRSSGPGSSPPRPWTSPFGAPTARHSGVSLFGGGALRVFGGPWRSRGGPGPVSPTSQRFSGTCLLVLQQNKNGSLNSHQKASY